MYNIYMTRTLVTLAFIAQYQVVEASPETEA